jgi:hypothetical protein
LVCQQSPSARLLRLSEVHGFQKGRFIGLFDEVLAMAGTTDAQQGQHDGQMPDASVLQRMMQGLGASA